MRNHQKSLHNRFAIAGIKKYNSFVADLITANGQPAIQKFDLIICDAPCTGSGTWSRTPEQLFYFKKEAIKLAKNDVYYLKKATSNDEITQIFGDKSNEFKTQYLIDKVNCKLLREHLKNNEDDEVDEGTLDLDSAFEALKVHQPHTSLFPPKVTNLPEGSLQYIAV